jgi:RecA/RadA recombinase
MINIIGDTPKIPRIKTGLFSFDNAFKNAKGEYGFPVGTTTELSGPTFCGKSTLVFGLSGMIAKDGKFNIALADFEGFDPEFLMDVLSQSGFDGSINVIQKESDEKTLDALLEILGEKEYGVGILDSVGAISPISEVNNDLGAANMGRRALLMSQFARKATHLLRFSNKSLFLVNHIHPNLGSMGTSTPGGETLKYLSAVRIRMKKKEEFPDQSYAIEGKVTKNRFGYRDRIFYIVMLSGVGIHIGLTAMYDCFVLGLAERGKVVKIDGKSFGYMKDIFKEAHNGNNAILEPFLELINGNPTIIDNQEPENDATSEVED